MLPACTSGIESAPADEACEQAKYAVASAQYACGVDPRDANAAHERFGKTYVCVAASAESRDFECAERILDTPCAQVVTRAADDVAYLTGSAACSRIFRRTDGQPIALSTVPSQNPVCEPIALRLYHPIAACLNATSGNYIGGEDGSTPHDNLRAETFAARAALDAAFTCLATDASSDPAACLEAIGCEVRGAPPLDQLLATGAPCAALLAPIAPATGGTP